MGGGEKGAERETLASRLGFIMLTAGCAVGLGNVWRFPFVAGRNGGAAFVLVYLAFLALLGFPLLAAELAIGRAARQGIASAMRTLSPERNRRRWAAIGAAIFAGNLLLMLYYTDVAGWLARCAAEYARGSAPPEFGALRAARLPCAAWMAAAVAVSAAVCALGVRRGVERATKWMMLALLAILAVLAVRSATLPGGAEGLRFYLAPDWGRLLEHPWRAVFDAMGQAFFTLSTGVGCMAIFGSYTKRDRSLAAESAWIVAIDTLVAILAGLAVFPACSAYGVDAGSGPGLVFIAMPKVFAAMSGGTAWGFAFFLFLTLAALTTIVAVFECIIGGLCDEFGTRRGATSACVAAAVAALSLPTVAFDGVLEAEDLVFGQFWLPIGALAICVFCTRRCGWGYDAFSAEVSAGRGFALPAAFRPLMRWVAPALIATILASACCG